MQLTLGRKYDLQLKDCSKWDLFVWVEAKSGKVDDDGMIVPLDVLDEAVDEVLNKINHKKLDDISNLKYVPPTLEMAIIRLWDMIEDNMPYQARLKRLKLFQGRTFWAEYALDPDDNVRKRKRS
jgi:6-pyruvoyl-tetrahydropterin synthase